jgi:hypothetical protein
LAGIFFSAEALSYFGTVRTMASFAIEIKNRAVEIAGIKVDPDGARRPVARTGPAMQSAIPPSNRHSQSSAIVEDATA